MPKLNQNQFALATVRASYVILAGFILMILLGPILVGISGKNVSIAPLVIAYFFALLWQIVTVFLNRRRFMPWLVLGLYLSALILPFAR